MEYSSLDKPKAGAIRFNTDLSQLEIYDGNQWTNVISTSPYEQTGGTRGLFGGGEAPSLQDRIDYINVDNTGNAVDFGDISFARRNLRSMSDRTRMIFTGGYTSGPATFYNTLEYVTMSSTGNVIDFGDLTKDSYQGTAGSNAVRALAGAGTVNPSDGTTTMQYVTIATLGNGLEFGELAQNHIECGEGACSPTRIVIPGSFSSNNVPSNKMEFAQIMTTGNFLDFGDLTTNNNGTSGGSNGHGGL